MSSSGPPRGLDPAERQIFAAVAATIVAAPIGDEVVDAVEPLVSQLPPADRRLLGVLLRAIEFAAPLLSGGLRRFSTLPAAEREVLLRAWSESRLEFRRQGIAALKALATLAYYGREEAWAEVGYHGPWLGRTPVAVLPAPELAAPAPQTSGGSGLRLNAGVTRGGRFAGDLLLRAEVCVIGTGAGGAAALARLAERGVDVIAVEAGGLTTAADFTQRELEMLPLLYRESALRGTADKAISVLQGHGVGGSTLHNTGLVYPPPPAILERWRREHGFELSAAEVEREVTSVLSTLHAVPIPPHQINPNNAALRQGAEALGWRYRTALHNRAACSACGYCMLGCAYNRKYNATLTFLPRAIAAGARILADASALRIEGRAGARRVVCSVRGAHGPRTAIIDAATVVLAAGALDTPALLLRSRLGNGQVGRGLRLHPAAQVTAVFAEPVTAWRGLPQSIIVEEFASFEENGYGGWLFVASAANWPGLGSTLIPGFGVGHRRRMQELRRQAAASVLLHDETEGRVRAGRDGRPVVDYWPNAADLLEMRRGIQALARLYLAARAERVFLPHPAAGPLRTVADLSPAMAQVTPERHRLALNSVHPQGSCRIAADPRSGAVDPTGRLWGAPGVYVADASLFPTSVGVPPQVTVMALAAAVAERVAGGTGG